MDKKIVILALLLIMGTTGAFAAGVNKLRPIDDDDMDYRGRKGSKSEVKEPENAGILDKETVYYPNATLKSAISKYQAGNYSGCLQELYSLTKKDPSNAAAYYYMAMAYTHIDMEAEAIQAYDKVIALNSNSYLSEYAIKGRDCLTGGPACHPEEEAGEQDELDQFVNAPYGNGMSPELNEQVKQKQLTNIKETINKKEELEIQDIEKIREFDKKNNKSSIDENDKIAQVSDEEILSAIKTLRDAGLTLNIQSPYMGQYQDSQMAELSMMLGGNNNNNNNMMSFVPMLMAQNQEGKNIDPRLMQAMMMNSMMASFNTNDNNNRY